MVYQKRLIFTVPLSAARMWGTGGQRDIICSCLCLEAWYNPVMRWIPKLDHFGLLAPHYERVITHVNLEMLLNLLELKPENRLLDAGGGTGRVSSRMIGWVRQLVLTDVSWGMVDQARIKNGLQPVNAHAERLPFPDASFERILMVDAFHHVCDQEQTVAELVRVLSPGGRLVVEEPNIETFVVKMIAIAEKLALMRSHFVRPARMQQIFERYGGRVSIHQVPEDRTNVWLLVQK